ncbi:MAG: hypothetical protein IJ604_10270 [Prevotella sp.]|nr:hypothetical protein [Prevotella sp.]
MGSKKQVFKKQEARGKKQENSFLGSKKQVFKKQEARGKKQENSIESLASCFSFLATLYPKTTHL